MSRLVKVVTDTMYYIGFYLLLVAKQPVVEPVTYSSGGLAENIATDWSGREAASLGR